MGKTVTTYLIDGDPKGTRYAFISNKICQMFVVPRSNLSYLNEQEKLQKPAFYILTGEDESTKPQAYIGETENFKERVKDHDNKKSFWQKALIFVSKDADMTKTDVQYLEYKAIAEAKKAKTFVLNENKQTPKAPNLPEFQKDTMDEFFEDIKFLASFIGCNIFEVTRPKEEHLFYTKGRGCDAKGYYDASGFTILRGERHRGQQRTLVHLEREKRQAYQRIHLGQNGCISHGVRQDIFEPEHCRRFLHRQQQQRLAHVERQGREYAGLGLQKAIRIKTTRNKNRTI